MKRRTFFLGASAVAGLAALGGTRALIGSFVSAAPNLRQRQKLRMPSVLDAMNGRPVELTAMSGTTDFGTGATSDTLGYNGPNLGPLIRISNNAASEVKITNALPEPISVHWHGLAIDGPFDGGPHQPVAAGQVLVSRLETRQAPATAWYHSHINGATARQVHSGLAGPLLIEDGSDRDDGLPVTFGIDDFMLVLQDKRLDAAGRAVYSPTPADLLLGYRGDAIAINGQLDPYLNVPAGIVRLRILNASNARVFFLSFADGRPFFLVATEAGRLAAPIAMRQFRMSPAERLELLVDFSDGNPAMLQSLPDANAGMSIGPLRGLKTRLDQAFGAPFPVLELRPTSALRSGVTSIPATLSAAPGPRTRPIAARRVFSLDMTPGTGTAMEGMGIGVDMTIDGHPFDMARINLDAGLGTTEHWTITSSMMAHPFHIHGCRFQVLSEDGAPPRLESRGWKDVVIVRNRTELLVEFDNPAPRASPYMYHCHILEHEDAGMMGQFTVT